MHSGVFSKTVYLKKEVRFYLSLLVVRHLEYDPACRGQWVE